MAIRIKCLCGQTLRIKDALLGQKVRCPQCRNVLTAPKRDGTKDEAVLDVPASQAAAEKVPSAARRPLRKLPELDLPVPDRPGAAIDPPVARIRLYPPSPTSVPRDLIVTSASYRLEVILVLASLMLFAVLYVGLVIGSVYLVYRSVIFPIGEKGETIALKIWLIGGSVLLFLFLLKGLFKRAQVDRAVHVEITQAEHPQLFTFLSRLCGEVGAPLPHRVYVSPEVNAAVFYHASLLSLFLPARKNLLIGLGLVNVLNLSEFKAVLAHEFGHFSQKSMKLGGYVYMANRIIADMVFGRDWLDNLLAKLKWIDIRIAIFAWAFAGLVWVLRKILEGLFRAINFANAALSRQMEFNADLVAVSVTGSDALICGLARLDFATDALIQAWQDLTAAAHHQVYTQDLFYHQNHAANYLRQQRKDPRLGEPPPLPDDPEGVVQVFEPGDAGVPLMWASHPSNFDREQNAKRRYIQGLIDERSPWLLFDDAKALREKVTRRCYRRALKLGKNIPQAAPETVQAFIDDEHAETTYAAHYHGLYDDRYLELGDLDALVQETRFHDPEGRTLDQAYAELYADHLKASVEDYRRRRQEYGLLTGSEDGVLEREEKTFEFRGRRYRTAEAKKLRKRVERELEEDQQWLRELDGRVFRVHYHMARQLAAEVAGELTDRYRFHLGVQSILSDLTSYLHRLEVVLHYLSAKRELDHGDFVQTLALFREAYRALERHLATASRLWLPALSNVTAGESLARLLRPRALIYELSDSEQSLDGKWIGRFMEQLSEVCNKSQRIHSKSVGGILSLQEQIARDWHASRAELPEVIPVETTEQEGKG